MGRWGVLVMVGAVLWVVSAGCDSIAIGEGVVGEGALTSETREVGSFDGIEAGGGVHLEISLGEPLSVAVEAQANLLPILETEVRSGTLHIGGRESYTATRPVTVTIVTPTLERVNVSGGVIAMLDGLEAGTLAIEFDGGAQVTASGSADRLDLNGSGGAQAHLGDVAAGRVEVELSGGATADVNASDSVRGSASGGAILNVDGGATVEVETSGGAQVN